MKKYTGRIAAGVATVAVAAGLAIGGAAPANAIQRVGCSENTLTLMSDYTTCWGYAGYTTVTLYNVYRINSGNNAGFVGGSGGTYYFGKYQSQGIGSQTIGSIRIN